VKEERIKYLAKDQCPEIIQTLSLYRQAQEVKNA
jgi:hypothetical protein